MENKTYLINEDAEILTAVESPPEPPTSIPNRECVGVCVCMSVCVCLCVSVYVSLCICEPVCTRVHCQYCLLHECIPMSGRPDYPPMPHANYGTVKLHIQEEWEPTTAEEERYIEEDQRNLQGGWRVIAVWVKSSSCVGQE